MIKHQMNVTSRDFYVRKAFSQAASEYDSLTELHQGYACELLEKVQRTQGFESVLDVGMGTGWMTQKIKERYPEARVIGLDFAEGMLQFAREQQRAHTCVLADARYLPFRPESFDLIVSNMAYQWVQELPEAFQLCHQSLKPEGVFQFALFGENTFCELFDVLAQSQIVRTDQRTPIVGKDTVSYSLLSAGFKQIEVVCEKVQISFLDLMSLLRWTKKIGANRLHSTVYAGKEALKKASLLYREQFGADKGIQVTFEVILGRGKK